MLFGLGHKGPDLAGHVQGVGAGKLVDHHGGGGLAGPPGKGAVGPGAQLGPGHIPDPQDRPIRQGADDDIVKFFLIGETSPGIDAVLEVQAGFGRRGADLAGRSLDVLILHRLGDISGRESQGGQLVGPDPEAHGILPFPDDGDVADAINTGNGIGEVKTGVIAQKQVVIGSCPGSRGRSP